ncbi:MAG: InlB B-repeat-containing protein [Oscillospiraceae bacterium]
MDNTRHNIRLTEPGTGGKIQSSNQTAQPNTTVTLTAVPDSGYTLKSWIVKDEQQKAISVTTDKTDRNVGTFTMPKSNVTVTAEFESTSEITPTITSVALVKSADGSLVVNGVPSGDNWTITIPNTVSAETVAKIPEGLSGLNLKIETPTGVTVKQMDGGGSYEGDWSKGDIMCWMPVNEEVSFRAIAGTATKDYTIKLVYAGSPLLSDGSATRSSKTAATVTFTSNVAGTYYYKVVDHDAAAPTVDEIKKSTSGLANAGTATTFTISNLTGDARDVYIVVVAASGESAPLKIEIPDYDPNPGEYTITVNTPKGGTIIPNRTSANAGDEIIVTVTPDDGYQMVEGSLTYTLAIENGETVKITNNRFTMPEGNVTISCQWETAATTSTGITGFSINGVAGTVNNTTNTITITMPRGTDVTKLAPVIATNGVKSLTPGSGETVDFTNAVTYTAAMEDGSSKTYTVTVYVDKGTLADQFWDKLTDFANQVPWWQYAEKQQSTSKYPKYW